MFGGWRQSNPAGTQDEYGEEATVARGPGWEPGASVSLHQPISKYMGRGRGQVRFKKPEYVSSDTAPILLKREKPHVSYMYRSCGWGGR